MSENYQNSITDQICKVQTSKKLIALYDRLRYTSYNSYAQLHAKGEFEENGHKVHSLIGISIQDYSSGTGDKNIITRFHLAPEQIQFLLSRVTAGFPEFEWSQSKYLVCRMAMAILLHNSFLFPATYITTSRKY